MKDLVAENGLNVLFNNAGVGGKSVRLPAVKEEDIIKTFSINAMTPVMLSKVSSIVSRRHDNLKKKKSRLGNVSSLEDRCDCEPIFGDGRRQSSDH